MALLAVLGSSGCSALPPYHAVQTTPHKDVVSVLVYLDGPAGPEVYQRIALDEAARIRTEEAPRGLPLYEVKVEFLRSGPEPSRLAQVIVVLSGDGAGDVVHAGGARIETILY